MFKRFIPFLFIIVFIAACGGQGGNNPNPKIPTVPKGLTATAMDSAVKLNWNANSESNLLRYIIHYATTLQGLSAQLTSQNTQIVSSDKTSVEIKNLTNKTKYYFAIQAENQKNKLSALSTAITSIPVEQPPAVPKDFKAFPSNQKIKLTWAANTESKLKQYLINWGTSPSNLGNNKIILKHENMVEIGGLTNGTKYYFRIRAEKESGLKSKPSAIISAIPSQNDKTPPAVVSITPKDKSKDVAVGTIIVVSFSEEMQKNRISMAIEPKPDCAFIWSKSGDELRCVPKQNLLANKKYMLKINGQDLAGNKLAEQEFSFTTAAKPGHGSLDVSFANNGIFTKKIGDGKYSFITDAMLIGDKIYLAGYAKFKKSGNYKDWFVVVRLNQDGSLDTTFADHGVKKLSLSSGNDRIAEMDYYKNNLYFAGGANDSDDLAIVSLNLEGKLNKEFNSSGILRVDFGTSYDKATNIAINQNDGTIYVLNRNDEVIAFTNKGARKNSFGNKGRTNILEAFRGSSASTIIVVGNKILIGGSKSNGGRGNDIALLKLDDKGKADKSFSDDGVLSLDLSKNTSGYAYDNINSIAISNNKLIVAGVADLKFAILQFDMQGNLDKDFADKGVLIDASAGKEINAVAINKDDKIIVAGEGQNSTFATARYLAGGKSDKDFGTKGHVVVLGMHAAKAIMFDKNNKIIVAASNGRFEVARLIP